MLRTCGDIFVTDLAHRFGDRDYKLYRYLLYYIIGEMNDTSD
jgi:hypothetical protein